MTDPFSKDPNSSNGSKANNHSRNGHNDYQTKLPQPKPPRPITSEELTPETRRDIRRAFWILVIVGLIIGVITAVGVVWVMNRLDLIGVPEQQK